MSDVADVEFNVESQSPYRLCIIGSAQLTGQFPIKPRMSLVAQQTKVKQRLSIRTSMYVAVRIG